MPEFGTTRWTLVLKAGGENETGQRALADLFRAYWMPLYIYVRRHGHSAHDAEDLTQAFFADLLVRAAVKKADPARGRFRTFLLSSLTNYLHNARDHAQAARRGGNLEKISIDAEKGDAVLAQLSDSLLTPDQAYDRTWALTLMDNAMKRLRAEQARLGKERIFDRLWPHLQARAAPGLQDALAVELGLTRATLAVTMHRLTSRYRDLVRAEIAETVGSREDWHEEQRNLLGSLEA